MAQDKIMIVDNEMEIIQLVKLYLSREGFDVVWTTDSTKATALAAEENPDLILLDVVMPGLNGIELCSKIREHSDVPILFVSCKNQDMDKVLGLSVGGDDYITKPFSPAELVARVKAHLRRKNLRTFNSEQISTDDTLCINNLLINLSSHTVSSMVYRFILQQKNLSFWYYSVNIPTECLPASRSSTTYGILTDWKKT